MCLGPIGSLSSRDMDAYPREMSNHDQRRSIEADDTRTATSPTGALVHEVALEQSGRLERRLYEVIPEVAWNLVGNGLSNQSFILGPEGIICIDTGESREEMEAAVAELRRVCDAPLAAVLLTHFHYVGGTPDACGQHPQLVPDSGPRA